MAALRLKLFSMAVAFLLMGASHNSFAQSGQKPRPQEPPVSQQPEQPAPKKAGTRPTENQGKANSRSESSGNDEHTAGTNGVAAEDPNRTRYTYNFSQPAFVVHTIHIEHDDAGRGFIRFERRSDVEQITEPLQLSPAALERINKHWITLDYLGTAESYQAPRDHSNLGLTRLTVRREGRERSTEFNYSDVPDARGLADEYRRAAEQSILIFELGIAVESQPLETPKLIGKIETLMRNNFLSDPKQLLPLLRQLAEDERVPLVGRNHAQRIIKRLEK